MFDSVNEKQADINWGVIGGILAMGLLIAVGYLMVT